MRRDCILWRRGRLRIRLWVRSRNSVRLVELGSRGIQVEGLRYVGRLMIRGWFLKWSCFFIVWMRRLVDFRTRWCVETWGVGTKLRPKVSPSVSVSDIWWAERFIMALFLKLVWSSSRIQRFVFPKFLIVHVCRKNFLNKGLEYGCLGRAVIVKLPEPSLRFLLMHA